jgi:hypothetical protein
MFKHVKSRTKFRFNPLTTNKLCVSPIKGINDVRYCAVKMPHKNNKIFYITPSTFDEYKVLSFDEGITFKQDVLFTEIPTNFIIKKNGTEFNYNNITEEDLKELTFTEHKLSKWQIQFYNSKQSKDPKEYQIDKKNYNNILVDFANKLSKPINKQIAFVLDTKDCNTVKPLNSAGFNSASLFVPNWTFEEAKILADSKLCVATCEDYNHFLERHLKLKTKFDLFFLDDGKLINTLPNPKNRKRSSQDITINYVFNNNLLADECIFACVSGFRMTHKKFGSPKVSNYAEKCQQYIIDVAKKHNYFCLDMKFVHYGVRSWFFTFHLKK